jgi:hypothetical protein
MPGECNGINIRGGSLVIKGNQTTSLNVEDNETDGREDTAEEGEEKGANGKTGGHFA